MISVFFPQGDEIVAGQSTPVRISVQTGGASNKVGFMASVEDASGNHVDMISTSDAGAQVIGKYVTQTSSGLAVSNDSIDWNFEFTDNTGVDSLIVYVAVNFTNGNGTTSGDYVKTATRTIYADQAFSVGERSTSSLKAYPNPATDRLVVEAEGLVRVRLYSTTGRFLQLTEEAPVVANRVELNTSKLPAGAYILHATYENGETHYKHVAVQ